MLKLENATIAIFTPACARFPAFDGFIAYHGNGPVRVFGYQCKLNRAYPKHDAGWRKLFYCAAMLPLMVIRGEVGSIAAMSSSKHWFWVTRLRPSILLRGRWLRLWMRTVVRVAISIVERFILLSECSEFVVGIDDRCILSYIIIIM